MNYFLIGLLICISVSWFLNSLTSAFILATGREKERNFVPAFIVGFLVAQVPVVHQFAIYGTITVGVKTQEERKEGQNEI